MRLIPLLLLLTLTAVACDDGAPSHAGKPADAGTAGLTGGASGSGGHSGGGGSSAGSGGNGSGGHTGSGGSAGGAGSGGTPGSHCEASAPPLSPATLADAVVGEAYSQRLMIVGATASQLTWSVLGELPAGLSLTPDDEPPSAGQPTASATLSGTPVMAGTFAFGVSVGLKVPPVGCAAPAAQAQYVLIVSGSADAGPDAE